jgi:hypothetical protein
MLADAKNGWLGNNQDYDAAPDGCPSSTPTVLHDFPYKEFNSGAAVEGFAHFYSAMAFNEDTSPGADCEVQKHYDVDWDRSGVRGDTFADTDTFSCEGGFDAWDPPPVNQYVQQADNFDYLGDHCLASGQSNNRGTTYDWMRMFWDLRTDEGVTPDVIFAIWAEADPDDWNATGNGTGAGYPAFRMSVAAYDVGGSALQLKYNAVAPDNGTTR